MSPPYRFDRMEIAGSLGDLGTLLPIAIGMILINGLSPIGIFFSIGIYFILSGIYYGITVPVQPMKVIGAYAIATAMTSSQVLASAALMGLILLIIGGTNAITLIGRYIPKPVVRGVQLSTGILLMAQGVKFMIGTSKFQAVRNMAEPYLTVQHIGPVSIGIVIGIIGAFLTLLLLENRKFPAGLVVILGGLFLGLVLGTHEGLANLKIGIYFPELMPFGFPAGADFTFAFFALVLPQVPMTIGNAVVANADLSREYFGEDSKKVTYRSLTLSMGLANLMVFVLGGMPLVPRRRRSGGPLSLRRPHGRLQPVHRKPVSGPCPVSRRPCPVGGLSSAHGDFGGVAGFCGGSAGLDHPGYENKKGSVRRTADAGHHPGLEPGRGVHGRHRRGLCFEVRKIAGIIILASLPKTLMMLKGFQGSRIQGFK